MAAFSQRFIRSVIRQIWNQARDGSSTFLDALNAAQSGYWQQTASGYTVQSSSGAGYSTSFHIAASAQDVSGATPKDFQELCEQILENYSAVLAAGTPEDEAGDATQSKFFAALCAYFPTIKGARTNWSYLNV